MKIYLVLRNSRKTECGAINSSPRLAGRAAPFALLASLAFLMTTGCSRESVNASANVAPETTVESVADRNVVTVMSPDRFSVAPAVVRRESDQTLANGVVAADVSRTYPVTALSSGRVVDIKARLGDDVQKGQLLRCHTGA
jgi:cobalt-zinc-cadmium efflux system membrane fusion protein